MKLDKVEADLAKAEDVGTHCNMAMAVAWDGDTAVKFFVDRLGGGDTSDRPVISVVYQNVGFFDVHLSSGPYSGVARATELAALMKTKLVYCKQWVVVGDFNQAPSYTVTVLGQGAAVDTKEPTHQGGNYDYAVVSSRRRSTCTGRTGGRPGTWRSATWRRARWRPRSAASGRRPRSALACRRQGRCSARSEAARPYLDAS